MTVCLDTNVFLQIFARRHPYFPILRALLDGRLTLAISTEIMLEYEEITAKSSGVERWHEIVGLLELIVRQHGNIRYVDPRFRFRAIAIDPDDNKFCDCAIAAEAEFVVSDDRHFEALKTAGYKPQPIAAADFIRLYLATGGPKP